RALHLLVQAVLLFVLFFVQLILNSMIGMKGSSWDGLLLIGFSVVWALVLRGGPSFAMAGVALVRSNGRRAARWQAAWRWVLVWVQGLVPLGAMAVATNQGMHDTWQVFLVVLALWAVVVVWLPRRALHDRLAGTYLVPE